MKMPDNWLVKLFTETDLATKASQLLHTLNAIANLVLLALIVYLPYQAIREVLTWFK